MSLTETQALAILQKALGPSQKAAFFRGSGLRVGIGDDAAVLGLRSGAHVWTVDACGEGTHFLWDWMSPEDVAHKSFHAAVSDVAAMGGRPVAVLSQLTLSPRVSGAWLSRFARAQRQAMDAAGAPVVGGNICFGEGFEVVTTVLGKVRGKRPLLRSTARPGDELWLVGRLGLARAGLLLLEREASLRSAAARECVAAFRQPTALLGEGRRLLGRASACLDVSDGLVRDAQNLATSSRVRVRIDRERLERTLASALFAIAPELGTTALDLALEGGEDYALLGAGPARLRPRFARTIGGIESGRGVVLAEGTDRRSLRGGYEHRQRRCPRRAGPAPNGQRKRADSLEPALLFVPRPRR